MIWFIGRGGHRGSTPPTVAKGGSAVVGAEVGSNDRLSFQATAASGPEAEIGATELAAGKRPFGRSVQCYGYGQQHTLYAYALPTGSPIDVVGLFDAIQHFLADRVWTCPDIWLVSPNGSESPEVGVNMVLPNPGLEPPGWFAERRKG